jgi:anthranilate synthase component I
MIDSASRVTDLGSAMLKPNPEEFLDFAATGDLVPVRRTFLFDADTAVTAYAKLRRPPFGFLLESVEGGEKWARYSFLGTEPKEAWRLDAGGCVSTWTPAGGWSAPQTLADPLADLDARVRARRIAAVPGTPRFAGGAVGYLGYDVIRYIERLPHAPPSQPELPEALFLFSDVVLAIDNLFGRCHAIALVDTSGAPDRATLLQRYDAAAARLEDIVRTLAETAPPRPLELLEDTPPLDLGNARTTHTQATFEDAVRAAREYIAAGDVFQVVLSQRVAVPLRAEPFDLYRALRSMNPSPYLFFLELDGISLVGSSPEALVRVEDGRVTVRPIAGTRHRSADAAEDDAIARELMADPKERAEHLMLVDLGRNDVGRVAEFGSVRVPEFMKVERYSHVMHLVSQVEGVVRPGLTAMDVFRACFPAGTVSGAPKIRAMEIIDELEPVGRGPYAGAVGYFAYGGESMDTAIAIRTLVASHGEARVQAGAGVVMDSEPAAEYQETLNKAAALLRVLAVTPSRR